MPVGGTSAGTNRPLRIALINAADQGGGAEASTLSLYRALKQLGHDCRVFVGTKLTSEPDVSEIARFRCVPGVLRLARLLEDRLGWQYVYHPWFRRIDRILGPETDIVHIQTLWSGRFGYADVGALPRLSRLYPTLMTLRDMWMLTGHCGYPALDCGRWKTGCGRCPDLNISPGIPHDGTRFNWARKRRAMRKSRIRVTTVSNWLADQVRQCPIFSGKMIHPVHNGIDREHFHPRSRPEMRRKYNLPQDAFIVMLAGQTLEGTFVGKTGAVDYALEALAASGVEPFILGVGSSSSQVLQRWGEAGHAVPFQNEPATMAELYCACNVVLVTSLWETFGRVAAEAQMCGVPVVAFATGGIPEIVAHEETGLVVVQLDSRALGNAIRRLHDHRDLRIKMGEAAARRAAAHFDNTIIAKRFVEHYRAALAEHCSQV